MTCYQEVASRTSHSLNITYPKHFGENCAYELDKTKTTIFLTDTTQEIKNELIKVQNEAITLAKSFKEWDIFAIEINNEKNNVTIRFKGERNENRIKLFKSKISNSPALNLWFESDELF